MRGLLTYISILSAIVVLLFIIGMKEDYQQNNLPSYPTSEANFISAINLAHNQASYANELQKNQIKSQRDSNICDALQNSPKITGWRGSVSVISSTYSGNAILEIRLPNGVILQTWNNFLSDIVDNTIIDKNSNVYKQVYNLSIGDPVIFSGSFFKNNKECARENSITTEGSLNSPEFLFKFSSIEKG